MTGENRLRFCEAQMIEIVQTYFDEHMFKKPPTVVSVKRDATTSEFVVETKDE